MSTKPRKIGVTLTKGGVGKTTTATNLGYGLAKFKKSRVLLLDCDAHNQAAFFLGIERDKGLGEFLMDCHKKLKPSYRDYILSVAIKLPKGESLDGQAGVLDIMPAGFDLALVSSIIAGMPYRADRFLSDVLESVYADYDYVILDVGPGLTELFINCMVFVDEIIGTVIMEPAGVLGYAELLSRITPIQKDRPELKVTTILPTLYLRGTTEYSGILEQFQAEYPELVAEPIHRTVKFGEAVGRGKSIFQYAPDSGAAADYKKLVERIDSQWR